MVEESGVAVEPSSDVADSPRQAAMEAMAEIQARQAAESPDPEAAPVDDDAPTLDELVEAQPGAEDDSDDDPVTEAAADDDTDDPAPAEPHVMDESIERWQPVMEQLGVKPEQVVDHYMGAVVSLMQQPVESMLSLMQQYVPEKDRATLMAAMAKTTGIDPFDVDPDSYDPPPEPSRESGEVARLRAEVLQMRIDQMRTTGDYPLLDDKAASREMASLVGKYTDMSLDDAYTLVMHRNPDLSAKHREAVDGKRARTGDAKAEAERKAAKVRKAKAATLPRGAAGARAVAPSGNSVRDSVLEAAMEIGFGR